MASSMTGMGIGEFQQDGTTILAELKSVNNRYLEVACRMPSDLSQYEGEVREMIRSSIHRGKLYVTISIQGETDAIMDIRVDTKKAQSVCRLLEEVCRATGVPEQPRLEHFLKFSEIFEPLREPEGGEKTWKGVKKALSEALAELKEMRRREGKVLVKDIIQRVRIIEKHIGDIETISMKNVEDTHRRMVERVKKLAQDRKLDEDRLYSEIVLMADKMDVTEECVRLRSHDQLFLATVRDEAFVGKKLNFLLQEMNREVNTISAKATNAEISHLVVEMKEEIERLREQVQNLE